MYSDGLLISIDNDVSCKPFFSCKYLEQACTGPLICVAVTFFILSSVNSVLSNVPRSSISKSLKGQVNSSWMDTDRSAMVEQLWAE